MLIKLLNGQNYFKQRDMQKQRTTKTKKSMTIIIKKNQNHNLFKMSK